MSLKSLVGGGIYPLFPDGLVAPYQRGLSPDCWTNRGVAECKRATSQELKREQGNLGGNEGGG
jgi:hypothetical protein